ncbi:MAG: hypothetical protein ACOH2Q_24710 [Rhodococcus sp. (in: high G+C Gram-positive bacteria)]
MFTDSDGTYRSPDFTIETMPGDVVLWEHRGMLDRADYAAKWQAKKKWNADNGVLPWTEGGGPNGTLVWTDDRGGVDVPALGPGPTGAR